MATRTALGHSRSGVDTKELRRLSKNLRGFKPDKALKKTMREAGKLVAEDAKVLASEHSKSIPPTIKVRLSKTRINIVAGSEEVRLAGLYELGNKGRSKSQAANRRGQFRHPVFGNRQVWVNQKRYAFLLPAAEKQRRKVQAMVGADVATALREALK
jgi:hypothetical protein